MDLNQYQPNKHPPPPGAHAGSTQNPKKPHMSNTKRKNNDNIQDAKVENFQAAVWATYVGWRSTRRLNQHNFRHKTFRPQPTLLKLIQLVCCNQINSG